MVQNSTRDGQLPGLNLCGISPCLRCLLSLIMNIKSKIKLLSWNVRGLNEKDKRLAVRQSILIEKSDVVCLQETKMCGMTARED